MRKRVHWVQRHIANNDLNFMPFQMSLNVRLTVYQYLRDIRSWKLQQTVIRLGGIAHVHPNIVEIDESCFSHKPKVIVANIPEYKFRIIAFVPS